jgi:hypothetical protein
MKLFKNKLDIPELLPTNVPDLDLFVASIIESFSLPNTDDTYDMIATMIMHMPQTACRAPKRYFGESVLKGMANQAAYKKLAEFRHKREEEAREAALLATPSQKLTEDQRLDQAIVKASQADTNTSESANESISVQD